MPVPDLLAPAADVVGAIFARALMPPPPLDLAAWAEEHVVFGNDSPFPGPCSWDRFPFWREILSALGPEDPCTLVVLKKSAQIGGTILSQVFVGAGIDLDPAPTLVVHPTEPNAIKWADTKWKPFMRGSTALTRVFGRTKSRDASQSKLFYERRDGRAAIMVAGAGSEANLSMITVKRQVQDDLSKWPTQNEAGDPEMQADGRSKVFWNRKVLKISTPVIVPGCRITTRHDEGTQEEYHVPCPHCAHRQVLTYENFVAHLPEDPEEEPGFACEACGGVIEERHRAKIIAQGVWIARYPARRAVCRSFHLAAWMAGLERWTALAERIRKARGDQVKEQVVLNDDWGLPFRAAASAPPAADLRARAEEAGHVLGQIPPGGLILTAGVDCQIDRCEVHVMAFGPDLRRWTVDYIIVPGKIDSAEARKELTALLTRQWPDAFGRLRGLDQLAIDGNTWTVDVEGWAMLRPSNKVMVIRTARTEQAPLLDLGRPRESNARGRRLKTKMRHWYVGAAPLKLALYEALKIADPLERGYIGFPAGLGEEFYQQLTAETRKAVVLGNGVTVYRWELPAGHRNEVLDTTIYAEAAAIRAGWRRMAPQQWDALAARLEKHGDTDQGTLFSPRVAPAAAPAATSKPSTADPAAPKPRQRFA